jgi:cell division protein FtsB
MASAAPRARSLPRSSRRPRARVRWDRVGRVAMLVVLVALLYLYLSAGRSYILSRRQADRNNAALSALERANAMLRAQRAALDRPGTVEVQARTLGMLYPGEQAYVVTGLPPD